MKCGDKEWQHCRVEKMGCEGCYYEEKGGTKVLVLPIKKKWFEMIVSGEKKEEYREIKPYYDSRFKGYMPRATNFRNEYIAPTFDIVFRNGYEYNSPSVKCRCAVDYGEGKEEWGAIPGKRYYILKILKVLEVRNYEL